MNTYLSDLRKLVKSATVRVKGGDYVLDVIVDKHNSLRIYKNNASLDTLLCEAIAIINKG